MKTILFHNPAAGDEDHSSQELAQLLRNVGLDVHPFSAIGDRLEAGLQERAELVVIAGGDGTVTRVAARWPDRDVPLAILPLGTANNLSRATGDWSSPKAFAAGWRQAQRRPLNVAVAESSWGRHRFLEAVGFGAFAQAVRHADAEGVEGVEEGRAAFRKAMAEATTRPVSISLDGESWQTESFFVEVMNTALVGPNLALAPQSDPGDGLLDVVVLAAERREAMLRWIDHPEEGPPPVEVRRGTRIRVEWPAETARLDDRCFRHDTAAPVTLAIDGAPLFLLVPELPGLPAEQAA
jgi:diacylglycerol kinase family enzyme